MPGGYDQIVYPEALFCLDVGTGVILDYVVLSGYKRDKDGDGGKAGTKRAFQRADMRLLMMQVLEKYGVPQDWKMHLLIENASATFSPEDISIFENIIGVKIDHTGLIRQKLTASGFSEEGGMPWQKGWIEAIFRLVHTRINHLPGTVGRRYDLTNGRQKAARKYCLDTIKAARKKGISTENLALP